MPKPQPLSRIYAQMPAIQFSEFGLQPIDVYTSSGSVGDEDKSVKLSFASFELASITTEF